MCCGEVGQGGCQEHGTEGNNLLPDSCGRSESGVTNATNSVTSCTWVLP